MSARSYAKCFSATPYCWTVYFFTDREKWARFTARRKFGTLKSRRAEAEDSTGICATDGETNHAYIGVFNRQTGTLAHEMTHAAMRILEGAGVKYSANNNEALAYLIGFMVDECTPALVATWKH